MDFYKAIQEDKAQPCSDGRSDPSFLRGTPLGSLDWAILRQFGQLSYRGVRHEIPFGNYWLPKKVEIGHSTFDGAKILIVEDDPESRLELLKVLLKDCSFRGTRIDYAGNIKALFSQIAENKYDVVILDKTLGDPFDFDSAEESNSIPQIPKIIRANPFAKIIMFTGSDHRKDIVDAVKLGAFDYSVKGDSEDLILEKIKKALEHAQIQKQAEEQKRGINTRASFFVPERTKSPRMKRILEKLVSVAKSEEPCLFLGETGVGKTEIARYVHELREQTLFNEKRPFVEINLNSFNRETLGSELFGHKKGSFTGAIQDKIGCIEMASGGSLFIDEIGDVPLNVQSMLIKVIEEKSFRRVGETETRKSDFKLICATNKNLEQLIAEGKFREDFYNRINQLVVTVPSLRDRKEDIPEYLSSLLPRVAAKARVSCTWDDLPEDFIDCLQGNPPRGNFRGLINALTLLLTYSPEKKESEKLDFKNWRKIPELFHILNSGEILGSSPRDLDLPLGFEDLYSCPFNVVGHKKFKRLTEFVQYLEDKVVFEAKLRAKNHDEVAKMLGIPLGSVSRKLDRIKNKKFWKKGVQ